MNTLSKKSLLMLWFSCLLPFTAEAYTTYDCPNGLPAVWEDNETNWFAVSPDSFPGTSPATDDLLDQMEEWENVGGSDFDFVRVFDSLTDGIFTTGNGVSEIGFITGDEMDLVTGNANALGITLMLQEYNVGGPNDYCHFTEADIMFDADRTWGYGNVMNVDPVTLRRACNGYCFKEVALHELGHALGLGHTTDYGRMVTAARWGGSAHSGTHPFEPLPDDREGIRALYPSDDTEQDLEISHYFVSSDGTNQYLDPLELDSESGICPGDDILVRRTALNLGNVSASTEINYYLSTSPLISTADLFIESESLFLSADSAFTDFEVLTIPSSANFDTDYFIGAIIDPDDDITEEHEFNNDEVLQETIHTGTFSDCFTASYRSLDEAEKGPQIYGGEPDFGVAPEFLREMLRRAVSVIIGNVFRIESYRIEGGAIFSDIHVQVHETLKGKADKEMIIRQVGGTIEEGRKGVIMQVEGAPTLEVGEEYVLFVGQNGRHWIPFVDGERGVIKLQKEESLKNESLIKFLSEEARTLPKEVISYEMVEPRSFLREAVREVKR